jgi:hypothetical protein
MASVDDAIQTQIRNIEQSTGRSMTDWIALVSESGKSRHGEVLAWLKSEHGLSHGNANRVALTALRGPGAPEGDARIDAIYAGPKAALRPFHDQVLALAQGFGGDIEMAPKQAYVALRRSKQFATVGPASGGRLEIGLNLKGVEPAGRLEATTGMCTHRIRLSSPVEFDDEARGWLREAYDRA